MGDMYFQQFYLGCLSHASYVIGSEGIAAVVDPQLDVGIYIEDAVKHGLRIEYVIETHLHADVISGHAELAALPGATLAAGGALAIVNRGGTPWDSRADLVVDGGAGETLSALAAALDMVEADRPRRSDG